MWRLCLIGLLACAAAAKPREDRPQPIESGPEPVSASPTCMPPVVSETAQRLLASGMTAAAWTDDDSIVALGERHLVTVWRGSDGSMIDRLSCGDDQLVLNEIAISPDARWVVGSGNKYLGARHGNRSLTCIIDLSKKRAELVEQAVVDITFDHRSQLVGGVAGQFARMGSTVLDLETGKRSEDRSGYGQRLPDDRALIQARVGAALRPAIIERATGNVIRAFPASEVAVASADGSRVAILVGGGAEIYDARSGAEVGRIPELEGAEVIVLSRDGRQLLVSTADRVSVDERARLAAPPPPFLALWDVATKRRVWRRDGDPMRGWQFTLDGKQLALHPRYGMRLRADTGAVIQAPTGAQFQTRWSHSGHRLIMNNGSSAELWAGDPPRRMYPPEAASSAGATGTRCARGS